MKIITFEIKKSLDLDTCPSASFPSLYYYINNSYFQGSKILSFLPFIPQTAAVHPFLSAFPIFPGGESCACYKVGTLKKRAY